jgi:hypothetical protein
MSSAPVCPTSTGRSNSAKSTKVKDWIAQAIRDAKDKLFPVVAHKRTGEDWLITLRAADFLTILRRSDFLVPTQTQPQTK